MDINSKNIIATLISLGIPPASATIIHCLLIAPPYHHSHTSLHEQTGLSKAAVTGGLRYLEALDMISYQTDSSRRQHIALDIKPLVTYTQQRMLLFDKLADELHAASAEQVDSEFSSDIAMVAELYSAINETIWQAITTWEEQYTSTHPLK
ncbi:hypothetical protein FBF32_03235 [Candidatus Saccharibacteria bacterium oral taxon 488]|jgi:hypothetical protein|nr:hypothetical protein FBF32_03235 [Candidatus Saccharibacteria bacterium oral taxon 488]QJU10302.1 hypothetical protein FBF26_03445 [Candidatus Saccharibacteria bacterium oral taxon 488]